MDACGKSDGQQGYLFPLAIKLKKMPHPTPTIPPKTVRFSTGMRVKLMMDTRGQSFWPANRSGRRSFGSVSKTHDSKRIKKVAYLVQRSGNHINRLALQEANADDKHCVVDNSTQSLIQSELDGGVLDIELLGCWRCRRYLSLSSVDSLLDDLTVVSAKGLGTGLGLVGNGLLDAGTSLELLCLCPDSVHTLARAASRILDGISLC